MTARADLVEQFKKAFCADDAASCAELLDRHPELKADINEPVGPFDSPLITNVRTREMLDVLLAAGADINARSRWWAGGFGLLDSAKPELAAYAIQRGAMVDIHSAARLGMIDMLVEFISAKPESVNSRGGDGQTPLHFASTVEVARYLLDHGAAVNARDIDHESTPAQYMVRDRQEIVRFLIERGCETDLLMASAIGDAKLVQQHLERNPDSIRIRVNEAYFPKANPRSGGTIYQWTLGSNVSAHDVAKEFKHDDIFRLLMDRSPPDVRLLAACWSGDEVAVQSLLESQPDLAASLVNAHGRQVADAARNNNFPAVRLMLAAGLPVNALGQHSATPLHWAGFHGNLEMTNEILRHQPALELKDADFNSSPLGWAIHGSENGWYCRTGNYAGTVEAMLNAGAKPPEKLSGTQSVKEVLRKQRVNESD
jgi:ankyrin repeat protein